MPFLSVYKAASLAVAQLGVPAFFIGGVLTSFLGASAAWFVMAAAVFATFVRSIELESWALLLPGGLVQRVKAAFGPRASRVAAAATLSERLLFAAIALIVIGHYLAAAIGPALAGWRFTGFVKAEDLATLLAVVAAGFLWLRVRVGRDFDRQAMSRGVWIGVATLLTLVIWALVTIVRDGGVPIVDLPTAERSFTGSAPIDLVLTAIIGFALAIPAIGGGEALARAAHELPPPRVQALQRTAWLTVLFAVAVTGAGAILAAMLLPAAELKFWADAPLAGLAQHIAAPQWMRTLLLLAVSASAVLLCLPAANAAISDAERLLHRASVQGLVPRELAELHTRFGTPTRAIDLATILTVGVVIISSGRITWLSRTYAMTLAVFFVLTIAALIALRRQRAATPAAFTVSGNVHVGARVIPFGLVAAGLVFILAATAMILTADGPSFAGVLMVGGVVLWFTIAGNRHEPELDDEHDDTFDLLASTDVTLRDVEARPGNVLVPVRNPHALGHVAVALQAAGDRDVVVMTVRMLDVDEGADNRGSATEYEHQLLSEVVAIAERMHRPVRLLIVPASNVIDAIAQTAIRLRSSDVYVGESATLSSVDQARLVGEAWEHIDKPESLSVRMVIVHRSGRTEVVHLGVHAPSLGQRDLELIHRLWLDASKTIGPHLHHHDVVRAALTQMEQQLNGPQREEALAAIGRVARPAEELAGVVHAHDYARLRDMARNRDAGELAELLTAMSLEDQVVVFRVLPRRDAAAVFEYLSHDDQNALLKAMGQEDVAALLNNMAPDDRTMFLEELPAAATRQLLSLLNPEEKKIALTLLGYPEGSVGRLMTPSYIAVREEWTVRQVLDYVREHGQDSETLNVIYIVDADGHLIDDLRIREFLLAPLDKTVRDLMDRRYVTLKATDDQASAVGVFRQYDRSALPVTDTAGVLIGIVTIDDVLDVAEAAATREIQRIGGSEALDEPYMDIAFGSMVRKRAGWLTALFLGEMLTATAMGFFENEISKAVVLALFVPLIISSGGNSGSQAATLVIRALALGEVSLNDWWRIMRRELLAGLTLGAILGSIGFLRITLWSAFSDIYGQHWLLVALTVSISLVGVVLWGTLSGSLLPLLLRRLGFDPAASSAPFVATLVDVTGLVIYFSVAVVVLRGTLL